MKIFYYNPYVKNLGGAGSHAKEFIQAIKKINNVDLHLYPDFSPSYFWSLSSNPLEKFGVYKFFPIQHLLSYILSKEVKKETKTVEPDIILARGKSENIIQLSQINKPLLLEVNAPLFYERYPIRQKGHKFKNYCSFISSSLKYKRERKAYKRADLLITVSWGLKRILRQMGIEKEKIVVVPNGVNPNHFNPDSLDRKLIKEIKKRYKLSDKFVVGYLGSFSPNHDFQMLLESFKEIVERGINALLFVVGKKGKCHKEVEKKVRNLKLSEYISYTGYISYQDLPHYISVMDVATSFYQKDALMYCSPLKMFEYAAMKCPIIGTHFGQQGRILKDKKTALLIEPNNINQAVDALLFILNHPKKAEKIGKRARKLVKNYYTWQHNARRIVDSCKEFL